MACIQTGVPHAEAVRLTTIADFAVLPEFYKHRRYVIRFYAHGSADLEPGTYIPYFLEVHGRSVSFQLSARDGVVLALHGVGDPYLSYGINDGYLYALEEAHL